MERPSGATEDEAYSARLRSLESRRWKRWLRVQALYRRNLRRLQLGRTLEVGCGIGRNLVHLGGDAVGIDHNLHSVEIARQRGCVAYDPEAFRSSPHGRRPFDSLLFSHVLEHMPAVQAEELLFQYLTYLRPGGQLVLIAPQEAGFRSDPTHVEFLDFAKLRGLLAAVGCAMERAYSFPFPRMVGRFFVHNEFVVVGRKP